jgi:glycine/D-amino acid oxidase-like deaminating enzyme
MTRQTADIVIAGAGVIGLCAAVQLARRSTARIVVLERAATIGAGSTGASSAICRHKYSLPEMITLAGDGIAAYRHWTEFLGTNDVLARYQGIGVLWLGNGDPVWTHRDFEQMSMHGIRAVLLDDGDLQNRFPSINPCLRAPALESAEEHRCVGGGVHLLELDGGYIDPVDVLNDLLANARAKGVDVRFRAEVDGIETAGGRVSGVRLVDQTVISAPVFISAGGPWCTRLFAKVGLASPWRLEPTRIQIAHIDRPREVIGDLPVTVDQVGGIYFRTQNRGQQIIVGSIQDTDERELVTDPDQFATYADDEFMRSKMYVLEHRLRGMSEVGRPRGYSGLYTINRHDFHPIVGPTPIEGLLVANGMSGHGFKLAPAIGSLIAQMLAGPTDSFDTRVDPAFLSFERAPIALKSLGVLA